ncbi:hypothetical protein BRADI_4g28724v3 [Brachypodium distachyon]|uniref:Uncharacterized protein n=1 Tax=Brachypodium distachyon TaxID=15368 RepID=A0A2K2CQY3_BRADI|nr:hypothetical protein BRADI_4g28724v3 [Brachypodium distachyon]
MPYTSPSPLAPRTAPRRPLRPPPSRGHPLEAPHRGRALRLLSSSSPLSATCFHSLASLSRRAPPAAGSPSTAAGRPLPRPRPAVLEIKA